MTKHDWNENEFVECDTCRVKAGMPLLCAACIHNRKLISSQRHLINLLTWKSEPPTKPGIWLRAIMGWPESVQSVWIKNINELSRHSHGLKSMWLGPFQFPDDWTDIWTKALATETDEEIIKELEAINRY